MFSNPEVIRQIKSSLGGKVPLIGFAGAPFTVASYLVEGRPSRDYGRTKALMLGDPVLFIEHKRLYTLKEDMSDADLPPIGKARVARSGNDVTLIAYSAMV